MKITYDHKTWTFSEITMDEFRAIRDMLLVSQSQDSTTGNHEKDECAYNIADQLDAVTISGF